MKISEKQRDMLIQLKRFGYRTRNLDARTLKALEHQGLVMVTPTVAKGHVYANITQKGRDALSAS